MPITAEMIEARRNWVGSSDIGSILGVNPYRSAYDVWAEKLMLLEPEPESKAARAGNRFEAAVLDEAEESLGSLRRNVHIQFPNLPFPLASNLDAQVIATNRPVEGKTGGLLGGRTDEWGEEGTDAVPYAYNVQAQVHILVTDSELCHLPAFLYGRGFCMFEVPRNNDIIEIIIEKCAKFWECVKAGTPPESIPTLEVAKRIRRTPDKIISVPKDVMVQWKCARETHLEAEKARKFADAALLAAMADAEVATSEFGTVTYDTVNRKGYTVQPSSYRQLKFKAK